MIQDVHIWDSFKLRVSPTPLPSRRQELRGAEITSMAPINSQNVTQASPAVNLETMSLILNPVLHVVHVRDKDILFLPLRNLH